MHFILVCVTVHGGKLFARRAVGYRRSTVFQTSWLVPPVSALGAWGGDHHQTCFVSSSDSSIQSNLSFIHLSSPASGLHSRASRGSNQSLSMLVLDAWLYSTVPGLEKTSTQTDSIVSFSNQNNSSQICNNYHKTKRTANV